MINYSFASGEQLFSYLIKKHNQKLRVACEKMEVKHVTYITCVTFGFIIMAVVSAISAWLFPMLCITASFYL